MVRRTCMSSSSVRLAALALAFAATPALACSEDEGFLFTCEAGSPERVLAICGKAEDAGEGEGLKWLTARVVYTSENGEDLSYPADPAAGPGSLYFSHVFRNDLYEANVRFENGGATYRLAFRDQPESASAEDINGPDAWLEMVKDAATTEIARCSERPSAFFDQMRQTLACDQQNPHGAQGCSDTPPNLK
jgi:hypothetical protein